MRVLVLNPGSSSLKYHLRDTACTPTGNAVLHSGQLEWADDQEDRGGSLRRVLQEVERDFGRPDAIGHRVVHGGESYTSPVSVTNDIIAMIRSLGTLAPLHNASSADCMEAAADLWPGLPQVAVFDTSFHRSIPDFASRYAVPENAYMAHPIRRYGFHGISVELACRDAKGFLAKQTGSLNAVVAHIGNGASVTAVKAGRSVDTSMGMTPLEGLVMGTRCGDLDPALVLLMLGEGATASDVDDILNHRSGLLSLAGTADMRTIAAGFHRGDPGAVLAVQASSYRLAKYIAAYAMAVGGPDAVIFTGGIGENSALYRAATLEWLRPLGYALDEDANRDEDANQSDRTGIRTVSTTASAVPVLVVPSDEERAIAESTASLLGSDKK
ncbi:acetate/propionate family kinase [Paenarthrobacter ureafaciens]|uniref:acetate/propionate family kinase n=1 Tax=Paenarthrobacter ureafaciens TaxID=37931 RepID=UPI002DB79E8E|nr:acetate/propionate family kinase [Paenarthrobacter ureafaciens]MEC3852135.1 acetate/propionate family kinase [Paenarthrobacter ureafaciens]